MGEDFLQICLKRKIVDKLEQLNYALKLKVMDKI